MPDDVTEVLAAAVSTVVCAYAVLLKLPLLELIVCVANVITTVNINVVVLVTLPPVAVTVIGKVPPDVAAVVPRFNIEEQLRLQAVCEKDPVAPDGKPATEKEICCVLPESKLPVIVSITDDPA